MKKWIVMMLAALMLLSLVACGEDESANADQVITRAAVEKTEQTEAEAAPTEEAPAGVAAGNFAFEAEGVRLVPGDAFDASKLPEAVSVFEVPSCAIEGTDNVYNYGAFEVTAFDDGNGEVIYSIYLSDPNVTTPEGLALGDDAARVVELYGENFEQDGTAYVYTRENTMLFVILENDMVASIEYRLITG